MGYYLRWYSVSIPWSLFIELLQVLARFIHIKWEVKAWFLSDLIHCFLNEGIILFLWDLVFVPKIGKLIVNKFLYHIFNFYKLWMISFFLLCDCYINAYYIKITFNYLCRIRLFKEQVLDWYSRDSRSLLTSSLNRRHSQPERFISSRWRVKILPFFRFNAL